jgi:hypothetical protein
MGFREIKEWVEQVFGLKPGMALVVAGLIIWILALQIKVDNFKEKEIETLKSNQRKALNKMIEGFDKVDETFAHMKNSKTPGPNDDILPAKGSKSQPPRDPSEEKLQQIINDLKKLQNEISATSGGPKPQGEREPASNP